MEEVVVVVPEEESLSSSGGRRVWITSEGEGEVDPITQLVIGHHRPQFVLTVLLVDLTRDTATEVGAVLLVLAAAAAAAVVVVLAKLVLVADETLSKRRITLPEHQDLADVK